MVIRIRTLVVLAIAIYAYECISMWRLFVSADRDKWLAIVPLYNLYILHQISGSNGAFVVDLMMPAACVLIGLWTWWPRRSRW